MNVILISHGSNKIGVVKAIEEITGKSLYESKQLAEKAPSVICQGLTEDAANLVKHKLELIGGTAVLATTTEATQQQSPAPPAATVRTLARERLLERPSRDVRLAPDEAEAAKIAEALIGDNIKKGWNKL